MKTDISDRVLVGLNGAPDMCDHVLAQVGITGLVVLIISVVAVLAFREVTGRWPDPNVAREAWACFPAPMCAGAAVYAVAVIASWTVRGPVRLLLLMTRRSASPIPQAKALTR